MEINTQRLTLRPFRVEDEDGLSKIYRDEDICRYLLHEVWNDKNQKSNFAKKVANNHLSKISQLNLAVILEGEVIGDLSAWYTGVKDTVEIGYSFSKTHGGKGYASEAVYALIKGLFLEFNLHRIQANLDARNMSSYRLCERIGMREEAHFIQDFWNKGEWTDSFVFGILASEI